MTRSVLLMSAAVALAVLLSACTSETPGLPGGQGATTPTGSKPTGGPFSGTNTPGSPTSGSNTSTGPLAGKSACSLLTQADVSGFQLAAGKEDDRSTSRECEYLRSGQYFMSVTIYDSLGIQDIQNRAQLKQITVGNREAVQGVSPGGACAIAIKTSEKSRVDATVVMVNPDERKACEQAGPLAQAVEKNLP